MLYWVLSGGGVRKSRSCRRRYSDLPSTSSVTNGGVCWFCLYHGYHQRGTAVRNAEAGMAGAAHALESGCKDSLGA